MKIFIYPPIRIEAGNGHSIYMDSMLEFRCFLMLMPQMMTILLPCLALVESRWVRLRTCTEMYQHVVQERFFGVSLFLSVSTARSKVLFQTPTKLRIW
jgi:hypothetical protein